MDDVELAVKRALVEMLGIADEDFRPEAKLINDLGADSLDAVEIALSLEEALSIEIDDSKIEDVQTVQQLINLCRKEVTREQTR